MNAPLTLERRVQLRDYTPREPLPYELATDQEIWENVGNTLIIDTETYANYHLVQFRDIKTRKVITLEFPYNAQKLSWIMHSYRVVGFNIIKYDLPVIWLGFKYMDLELIRKISSEIIYNNTWPQQLQKDFDFKIWPTNTIDLIEVLPGIHSLKLYMGRLHSKRIQDLPFPIDVPLTPARIEVVRNYCLNDLDGTEELFAFSADRIKLREELGIEYRTDLRSKSDAQMAEAMVAKEIHNKTGKWPKKADLNERNAFHYNPPSYLQFATPQLQNLLREVCETKFIAQYGILNKPQIFENYHFTLGNLTYKFGIGGLHSCEENVSYTSGNNLLIDRDVASYYPAIIINQGLFPKHLGSVFLDVYTKMRDDRIYAKKHKLFAKDKGLKIALNGVSGKFNSEYSIFYDPQCYLQMTLTGQLSVLMLAEMFECSGIEVISANTDGVVSYCPQSKYDEMLKWINYWEKATEFLTEETQYKSYHARDVNAYFAVKLDGSVKVKGPYSEVGSQTGTKLDNNPICLICSDAIKELLANGVPIEKTIRECRDLTRFITVRNVTGGAHKNGHYLGKTIRWYHSTKIVGTINYIQSGNKVPETEGAMPTMDLPSEFPSDVNYDFYIDKTIKILYEINYIKRPKQQVLF
jgi:hypothetical protein